MQGAQNLRSEAYLQVRGNDEGEAQRRRWTFYETITVSRSSSEQKGNARKSPTLLHPSLLGTTNAYPALDGLSQAQA